MKLLNLQPALNLTGQMHSFACVTIATPIKAAVTDQLLINVRNNF